MGEALVTVRVLPGCTIRDGAATYYSGYEFAVTEQDARALEKAELVERVNPERGRLRPAPRARRADARKVS